MIAIAWPWLAVLLPLPILLRWLLPAADSERGGVLFAPFATGFETRQAAPARSRRWLLPALLWLLLLAAAIRPQWLDEPVALPETGRNLMLAVDVSGSMEQQDMARGQTRLDVVKQVAGDFIERRGNDRLGLILFGSQAYLQSPLTFDRQTLERFLRQALVGIAGKETAMGDAIGLALKRLRESPGESILILLTDGQNTAGRVAPLDAARLAAQAGLRIHTIGVGGDGGRVAGLFGMPLMRSGADLDEKTLRAIAQATGGRYFRARDRDQLAEIYREIDVLEPISGGERWVRPVTELYPWPLGSALLISLAWAGWVGLRGSRA